MTAKYWKIDKRRPTGFRRGMCRDCYNARQRKTYENTPKYDSVFRWENGEMQGIKADLYRCNYESRLHEIRQHLGIK